MEPGTWVAIYAAVVATSALLLNFKTWFDSGVRLRLHLVPDGMTIGGGPDVDEKDLVILTVINRGDAPTMITNMILWEMPTVLHRLRIRKPANYFVVTNPHLKEIRPTSLQFGALKEVDWCDSEARGCNP
jgi:hypothetical protein